MSKELNLIFSENLERLLYDRKKTQAEMARHMKVSSATASDWVNGKKMPRAGKLISLANWLHVELSDLLEDKGETSISVKLTNYEEQLLQRFRALPPRERRAIEVMINTIYMEDVE